MIKDFIVVIYGFNILLEYEWYILLFWVIEINVLELFIIFIREYRKVMEVYWFGEWN